MLPGSGGSNPKCQNVGNTGIANDISGNCQLYRFADVGLVHILIKIIENEQNAPNRGGLEMLPGSGCSNPK